MSFLKMSAVSAATILSLAPTALAGFDGSKTNNVAVYWGTFPAYHTLRITHERSGYNAR